MIKLGAFLKEQRIRLKMSLKDVQKRCGITDSRLSRFERGEGKMLDPLELKRLARLYDIDLVQIFVMAEYIDESDLEGYQMFFKGAEQLSDEERSSIQKQIDLFIKLRGGERQ